MMQETRGRKTIRNTQGSATVSGEVTGASDRLEAERLAKSYLKDRFDTTYVSMVVSHLNKDRYEFMGRFELDTDALSTVEVADDDSS